MNRGLSIFVIWVTAILGRLKNRAAEAQRRHLEKLAHLGRVKTAECLAGALAHELNQPLTAVALQADVARQWLVGRNELDRTRRELSQQRQLARDRMATLTSREREVLDLVTQGKTNKEMAAHLHLTLRAIEDRRARLMRRVGVTSLAELLTLAQQANLDEVQPK